MIVEYDAESGQWIANGTGPLRPITTYGASRQQARDYFVQTAENQRRRMIADQHELDAQIKHAKAERFGDDWAQRHLPPECW